MPIIRPRVNILKMKKKPVHIAILILLAFLFSGIGVTSVLPILITTLAPAHPIFITEKNHKIRLVLHHPGNHDEHEVREDGEHHHDLLDAIMGVSKNNQVSHTDHEIDLPSFEEKIPTTTKSFIETGSIFPLSNIPIRPISIALNLGHHLSPSPSGTDSLHESFRTTILII